MGKKNSKIINSQAKNEYGQILLELHKEEILPGETLTGNVHLNLIKSYPGNQLTLKFCGKEYVHFAPDITNLPEGNYQRTNLTHIKHKEKTLELTIPLFSWGHSSSIPLGQYTFPFFFVIPLDIPGTFWQKKWCVLASVSYILKAYLEHNKPKKEKKIKGFIKLGYKLPITILQQNLGLYDTSHNIYREIAGCCGCLSNGNIDIRITLKKGSFHPGEIFEAIVDIDNRRCKYNLISIRYCIKQRLMLRTPKAKFTHEYVVIEGKTNDGVNKRMIEKSREIRLKLPEMQRGQISDYKGRNLKEILQYELEDNAYSIPTIKASSIISQNIFQIFFEFKGSFGRYEKYMAELPFILYGLSLSSSSSCPNVEEITTSIQAPINWAPKLIETNNEPNLMKTSYSKQGMQQNKVDFEIIPPIEYETRSGENKSLAKLTKNPLMEDNNTATITEKPLITYLNSPEMKKKSNENELKAEENLDNITNPKYNKLNSSTKKGPNKNNHHNTLSEVSILLNQDNFIQISNIHLNLNEQTSPKAPNQDNDVLPTTPQHEDHKDEKMSEKQMISSACSEEIKIDDHDLLIEGRNLEEENNPQGLVGPSGNLEALEDNGIKLAQLDPNFLEVLEKSKKLELKEAQEEEKEAKEDEKEEEKIRIHVNNNDYNDYINDNMMNTDEKWQELKLKSNLEAKKDEELMNSKQINDDDSNLIMNKPNQKKKIKIIGINLKNIVDNNNNPDGIKHQQFLNINLDNRPIQVVNSNDENGHNALAIPEAQGNIQYQIANNSNSNGNNNAQQLNLINNYHHHEEVQDIDINNINGEYEENINDRNEIKDLLYKPIQISMIIPRKHEDIDDIQQAILKANLEVKKNKVNQA